MLLVIGNKAYSSWSLRPWLYLKQQGIAFEERRVPLFEGGYKAALLAQSPAGKVPVLVDGAVTVWDSLAILEYLAEKHPDRPGWPDDAPTRAVARAVSAEMHSGFTALRNTCGMNCGLRVRLHSIPPPLERELRRLEQLWADGLKRFGGPFLTGERFCAADAFFAPVAFRIQTYEPPISADARRYADLLLGLTSMKQWYASGLAEIWRDPEHEEEVRASGVWTQDLRAR